MARRAAGDRSPPVACCSTPFTIQRLCELMTEPQRYYKRTDKFMRGVEKNVLVVTTIEATRSVSLPPLHLPAATGGGMPTFSGGLVHFFHEASIVQSTKSTEWINQPSKQKELR